MRGKVKFDKFPPGLYYCQIEDIKAGISSSGKDLIVVSWRVLDGPKQGELFKERLYNVSSKFLEALGEPHGLGNDWDTERWRSKLAWVQVKYSEDEAQWQRFGHHANNPMEKEPPDTNGGDKRAKDDEDIPF